MSLLEKFPATAAELHPSNNVTVGPDLIPATTHVVLDWLCGACGDTWSASPRARATGLRCTTCRTTPPVGDSLAEKRPDVAVFWDTARNGGKAATSVWPGTKSMADWACQACGHQWSRKVHQQTVSAGCPSCDGVALIVGRNDFASQQPEAAAEWDYDKNAGVRPDQVTVMSNTVRWWLCRDCGYSFDVHPLHRTRGVGCRRCAGKVIIPGVNDLVTLRPAAAAEWDPVKNGNDRVEDVFVFGGTRHWWRCATCDHSWDATAGNRSSGTGCPGCAGHILVPGHNDLASQNPEVAATWHPTRNGHVTPADVRAKDQSIPRWWLCTCGYEWPTSPGNRHRGAGCPACAGFVLIPGLNDLASLFPDIAAEFRADLNEGTGVNDVFAGGAGNYAWECSTCAHVWRTLVCTRTSGSGCPACAGTILVPGVNDLASQRPDVAAEWHPTLNGDVTPEQVFVKGSTTRYMWSCTVCAHVWPATASNRSNGSGCPECGISGFKPGRAALVYFLEAPHLGAFKVGITGQHATRIDSYSAAGWKVNHLEAFTTGRDARAVESAIHAWWRKDLQLPVWLDDSDMKGLHGATETITNDELTVKEVIDRIRAEAKQVRDAHSDVGLAA